MEASLARADLTAESRDSESLNLVLDMAPAGGRLEMEIVAAQRPVVAVTAAEVLT
jgi:hypothetical protein